MCSLFVVFSNWRLRAYIVLKSQFLSWLHASVDCTKMYKNESIKGVKIIMNIINRYTRWNMHSDYVLDKIICANFQNKN
jgi:hypothetical protein